MFIIFSFIISIVSYLFSADFGVHLVNKLLKNLAKPVEEFEIECRECFI